MPHGIAIGLNGFPYFAIAGANKIGRIDLKAETMQTWPVPSRSVVRHMVAMDDSNVNEPRPVSAR